MWWHGGAAGSIVNIVTDPGSILSLVYCLCEVSPILLMYCTFGSLSTGTQRCVGFMLWEAPLCVTDI